MKTKVNAKTQEESGRYQNRSHTNCTNGLGILEGESGIYGDDKNRHDNNACTRQNISDSRIRGGDSAGKILDKLGEIEKQYLSFLQEEKKLAKSKLQEIDEREHSLKAAIQQISLEVSSLINNE